MVEYLVVLQPRRSTFGLGSIRFRSPLLTESISLSFPPLTEMFHFSGFRVSYPYVFRYERSSIASIRLPHSDTPGIIACLQLPEDFRSLPRPSSPVGTKAFTVRPYLLHHIAKVFYHFHNTTKPFRDLLYCLISWYACFKLCIVVVFQLPTLLGKQLLLSNCFLCHADVNFRFPSIIDFLVGLTGLEPVTPRLSSACSNQLSYRPGFGSRRGS